MGEASVTREGVDNRQSGTGGVTVPPSVGLGSTHNKTIWPLHLHEIMHVWCMPCKLHDSVHMYSCAVHYMTLNLRGILILHIMNSFGEYLKM